MNSSKRARATEVEHLSIVEKDALEGDLVVLPIIEETLEVRKRTVDAGGVRVHKTVQEREQTVDEALLREEVQVERIPMNRVLDGPVEPRQEGDTLVIPVVEEVLVIEKRLVLKEEIRVTKTRRTESDSQRYVLQKETVVIESLEPGTGAAKEISGTDPSSQQDS